MKLTAGDLQMYEAFMLRYPYCWACGWARTVFDQHRIRLENAHIVGGPGRRHDRRAINRLCNLCHLLAHGARVTRGGIVLPVMTLWNMTFLKQLFDAENYDREYLQSLRTARFEPIIEEHLPDWFDAEFLRHRRCDRATAVYLATTAKDGAKS